MKRAAGGHLEDVEILGAATVAWWPTELIHAGTPATRNGLAFTAFLAATAVQHGALNPASTIDSTVASTFDRRTFLAWFEKQLLPSIRLLQTAQATVMGLHFDLQHRQVQRGNRQLGWPPASIVRYAMRLALRKVPRGDRRAFLARLALLDRFVARGTKWAPRLLSHFTRDITRLVRSTRSVEDAFHSLLTLFMASDHEGFDPDFIQAFRSATSGLPRTSRTGSVLGPDLLQQHCSTTPTSRDRRRRLARLQEERTAEAAQPGDGSSTDRPVLDLARATAAAALDAVIAAKTARSPRSKFDRALLEYARPLLAETLSVADVARRTGLQDAELRRRWKPMGRSFRSAVELALDRIPEVRAERHRRKR